MPDDQIRTLPYSHHYRYNERWVRVEHWEDYYSISNHGRLRGEKLYSDKTFPGRILRTPILAGYPHIVLQDGFRVKGFYVHQLVALAFVGPPPTELHEVNHKDGNKENNRPSNLEWMTTQENIHHYHRVLRPIVTGVPWLGPKPRTTGTGHPRVATEAIVRATEREQAWRRPASRSDGLALHAE